ncbi:GlxA family transcriptional regulator [Salinisphaera sp.]|uniref:GlxA family transcriptional regulator n=1 Tax=Salinisphaera sp. TaxID=1914330 RepID=UPI002D7907A6|nr:helix-turn-helix domain-containing protein [Salinisphaera sp.]HET7314520.1 helix-turn-helix domain-containing protein [Salinisphaera sp.]
MRATSVAIAAFDDIRPFHLSVPCAVFGEPAGIEPPPFDVRVCTAEPGELRSQIGFSISTDYGLDDLAQAHIVVVPSWRDPHEPAPKALLAALQQAHARGALIVGLCLGAYVLAEAGLLDGRRATTHWRWAEPFAQRFPRVSVDADVLYVDEGDVLTSAGTAAGIDCCLHVVRKQLGANVAARIARTLVVPPHRQGSQAQFIEQPVLPTTDDGPLAQTLDWVVRHLDQPHSLDSLAAKTLMSRRSFTRHFRKQTGTSVGQWLLGQRLALAQRLLETTAQPIERVAERAGFGSTLSMRQHFGTVFNTTPSMYRREFRGSSGGAQRSAVTR